MSPQPMIRHRGPAVVPAGWTLIDQAADGERYWNETKRLSLIWSAAIEEDGRPWLHVSIASPKRLPTWDELVAAKEWVAGTDVYAYQVIPPRSRYVNIHPYALHVFVPLDGTPPLPDFTAGSRSL